jgi:hypothetical protein
MSNARLKIIQWSFKKVSRDFSVIDDDLAEGVISIDLETSLNTFESMTESIMQTLFSNQIHVNT